MTQWNVVKLTAILAGLAGGQTFGDLVTWDGGPSHNATVWTTAANWNPDVVPTAADEAKFTDVGTSGVTISVGAGQVIHQLTFSTVNAFILNTGGNSLTLTNVVREDVAGSEGVQQISSSYGVPLILGGNSTWDINGDGYLQVNAPISDGGNGYTLTKNGSGELRLASTLAGPLLINEGTVRVVNSGNNVLNDVTVGDGVHTATLYLDTAAQSIRNYGIITVNKNATLYMNNYGLYQESMYVLGGTMDLSTTGIFLYNASTTAQPPTITMQGGLIRNGTLSINGLGSGETLVTTLPASTTAVISATLQFGGYRVPINVADGAAAIDLEITGKLAGNMTFNKDGDGVMALSSSVENTLYRLNQPVAVNAGTLLVNNTVGSGVGNSPVTVAGGATLGGIGAIFGSQANVTLTGSTSAAATLAPGSIDAVTGAALIGTLTIGDASQANSITFGNYSQLLSQLGSSGAADLLAVFGDLKLNSAANTDALNLLSVSGAFINGDYTLATFTGTLFGRFDAVTLDAAALPADYTLEYRDATGTAVTGTANITGGGSIVLVVIPEPASMALLGCGVLMLAANRRRRA